MREILFRGRCADLNKEWVEGFYTKTFFAGREECVISRKYVKGVYVSGTEYDYESYTVSPETVGQYTGLTDKNGKKIFEGDIVKGHISEYAVSPNRIGKVRWGAFGWIIEFNAPEHKIPRVGMCSFADIEVIGNIYDNPELLEVQYE